jgi:hypothetical protein
MASIVLQAIINGLTKQLEGMDPNTPEAQGLLATLKTYQEQANAEDKANQDKVNAEKDAKTKDKIKKKQAQIAIAKAKGQATDKLESDLDNLRSKILNPTDPERFGKELRYGPNGESLVPGTAEYAKGTTTRPTVMPSAKPGPGGLVVNGTNPAGKTAGSTGTSGNKTGKGGTGSAGSSSTATNDPKTAWISYLQTTFKTLPGAQKAEIDKLLTQAQAEKWNESTFMEALKGTQWWQETSPSLQQFFLSTHDPRNAGTFAQQLSNKMDSISAKLEALGVRAQQTDPITGKVYDNSQTIQGIAMSAIQNNWTDAQLTQHLGDNAQLLFTGGGTIGSSLDRIKKQALLYGVNIDNNYLNKIQTSLLDPTDGRDAQYYLNEMQNQAVDLYKPFADSIKSGRSLYEATNNYRTKMSTLLEVAPENLSWKDLMSKVIDPTTGNARTEADFTKQVKQDPLWQYTKNAKETYSNMAVDLMKQFGFMG